MKPYALIVDDFLEHFDAFRAWVDVAAFADVQSPVDGVNYPLICMELPDAVLGDVIHKTQSVIGCAIQPRAVFLRQSPKGVPVPHQAHNDESMGQYSLMLYLNRPEHCYGGTSFLKHIATGIERSPPDEDGLRQVIVDANTPDAWQLVMKAPMQSNRALIFPAELMHRAEPVHGFGSSPADCRVVLTMFFDLVAA